MKFLKKIAEAAKSIFQKTGAVLVSFFAVTGVAHAELPTAVTTAISGAETDITTAGGLILAVVVGIAVIGWIRRVIR